MKKYISPGSCFSLEYPDNWCEFEDSEDCFLFYNPDKWTGNFRISAYRGNSSAYANECLEDELHQVRGAKKVKVGYPDVGGVPHTILLKAFGRIDAVP